MNTPLRWLGVLVAGVAGPACRGAGEVDAGKSSVEVVPAVDAHDERREDAAGEAGVVEAGAAGAPAEKLKPLTDHVWIEEINVGPKEVVFVTVPLGTTEPRPLVVAVHGAGDRPEWSCGGWRGVSGGFGFVICPRGTPVPDGRYSWSSPQQLESLVERGVRAVRERFGPYVADGPPVLVSFSQGARMSSHVAARGKEGIHTVVFMEGGYDEAASGELVRAARGKRVLLACSTAGCAGRWAPARAALTRAGVTVRVHDTGPFGHNLNGEVVRSLSGVWPWVVEGDVRWAAWKPL